MVELWEVTKGKKTVEGGCLNKDTRESKGGEMRLGLKWLDGVDLLVATVTVVVVGLVSFVVSSALFY